MRAYNVLTKRLLAEGYTELDHPAWVKVSNSWESQKNTLDNMDGGFVYNWSALPDAIFKTPCGLHVKRRNTIDGMSWQGIQWTYENDLARIYCPFSKRDCPLIHPRMQEFAKDRLPGAYCNVAFTNEPYDEENSVEHYSAIAEKWKQELFDDFVAEHRGRCCEKHMKYDYENETWSMSKYNPAICEKMHCSSGSCQYLGLPFTRKKGNVFYDLRFTYSSAADDGTLFDGTLYTTITKGKKAFSHPADMLICTNYAKLCRSEIEFKVMGEYHYQKFMTERSGHVFQISVENIRAEKKETRDLRQDLEDIRNGITIVHETDQLENAKAQKRIQKAVRIEKEKARLRRKLVCGTPLKTEEESRAGKLFTAEEMAQIAEERRKEQERPPEPVQMSLFDFIH